MVFVDCKRSGPLRNPTFPCLLLIADDTELLQMLFSFLRFFFLFYTLFVWYLWLLTSSFQSRLCFLLAREVVQLKPFQNKKGQKNLRYPTKNSHFLRKKTAFFVGHLKSIWLFLFWNGFNKFCCNILWLWIIGKKQKKSFNLEIFLWVLSISLHW